MDEALTHARRATAGRPLRTGSLVGLLLAVAIAAVAGRLSVTRALMVSARDWMFTRKSPPAVWRVWYASAESHPGAIGFAQDDRESVRQFARKVGFANNGRDGKGLAAIVAEVVGAMPGTGGASCGWTEDIAIKTRALMQSTGDGCCSDFVEVFQALAAVQQLETRELINREHNFAEVWDASRAKWVFVDPQYGLLATNGAGELMSALEMADAAVAQREWTWVSLKGEQALKTATASGYYSASSFASLRITRGSDVIAQARFLADLPVIPKAASELLGYLAGRRPFFVGTTIRDEAPTASRQERH